MYYWDGQRWASTLSPDGRQRWNGSGWEPVSGAFAPAHAQARPPLREPTSWTRPLQYAVIARYAAAGIYGLFLPFWLGPYMSQVMQQSIQRQQQAYPPDETPPPGFTDMMNAVMAGSLWVGTIIGLTLTVIVIVAAMKRWTWAYYAILALIGFTLLGTVFNLINLVTGGALTAHQPQPPQITRAVGDAFGVIDTVLFVWMLVALVRRGPWAMRRISC
jgi:hypothetical protein